MNPEAPKTAEEDGAPVPGVSRRELVSNATLALLTGGGATAFVARGASAATDETVPPPSTGLLVILWDPDDPPEAMRRRPRQHPGNRQQLREQVDQMRFYFISRAALDGFEITDVIDGLELFDTPGGGASGKIRIGSQLEQQKSVVHAMYGELGNGQRLSGYVAPPVRQPGQVFAAESVGGARVEDVISQNPNG
jgi:hypothetical protein